MVFLPPPGASALWLFGWGAALSIASTATLVAYTAWGAELSTSYRGRSRVAAYREVAVVIGTVLAILATALIPQSGLGGDGAVLAVFAVFVGIGLPASVVLLVATATEPRDRSRRSVGLKEGLRHLAENAPFRRLVSAFFLNGFANGLPATLFLFYVGEKLAAAEWRGPLLLLYFLFGMAGVPVWLWLASRIGKYRAWCWAMLLASAAFARGALPRAWAMSPPRRANSHCHRTGAREPTSSCRPPLQADVIDIDTAAIRGAALRPLSRLYGASPPSSPSRSGGRASPPLLGLDGLRSGRRSRSRPRGASRCSAFSMLAHRWS